VRRSSEGGWPRAARSRCSQPPPPPTSGLGTGTDFTGTPSFYHGWSVDIGAASLLPTLLLVAAGLSLRPRPARPTRAVDARLAAGLGPALVAAVYLFPGPAREPTITWLLSPGEKPKISLGSPYPMPWIPESRPLLRILGLALAVAIVLTWRRARTHPAPALASGLVLLSVAYPLTWVAIRTDLPLTVPYQVYNGAYPLLLAAVPTLLALYLMRRAGRANAAG
jgi:hypothetical protein